MSYHTDLGFKSISIQPAVGRMVPEGVGIPEGHKEVESSWSEEGCDLLKVPLFNKVTQDLELLVSRWSKKSYNFLDAWGSST